VGDLDHVSMVSRDCSQGRLELLAHVQLDSICSHSPTRGLIACSDQASALKMVGMHWILENERVGAVQLSRMLLFDFSSSTVSFPPRLELMRQTQHHRL
jgi:hypothetical protein